MSISSLYKDYYQKSRLFLYPALKVKKGVSVTPIETYMAWEGYYSTDDCKLVCVYHLRTDDEFRKFEKSKLLGNDLFHDFKELADNKGVYVFDFSSNKEDFQHVVRGKYSKLSNDAKIRIMSFFSGNRAQIGYIESYLYPDKYFGLYAKLLCNKEKEMDAMEQLLTEVGELCSIPDLKEETFKEQPISLNITPKVLHLLDNQ
jgi:hypothetical protein